MEANSAEFEALLAPVVGPAYGYALRLTRNRADAEDLVQEATLHAWRGFKTFQRGSAFKPWFLRVLTNCHRATWRAKARRLFTVSVDDAPDLFLYSAFRQAGLATGGDDPADQLIGRLSRDAVDQAIRRLPPDYRETAALYFTEELSYQEIAEVLSVPVGTVRSRLHRARKLLQQFLWNVAVDEGIVRLAHPRAPQFAFGSPECEHAFRRLDDYLDRELTAAEMAKVRDHLEVCAMCSSEFAFEASLVADVRQKIQRIDVPADFRQQVSRRLGARASADSS
jgi:RNA polymerase sigma-70 factor (ECF subfamily)